MYSQHDPEENRGRIAVVTDHFKLEKGKEIKLSDWQITCAHPDGSVSLFNLKIKGAQNEIHGYEIKKGVWRVTPKKGLQPVKFAESVYYETETYRKLTKFFRTFKDNLHQFDFLGLREKKRGVLLGSVPGVGKSSLINKFCTELTKESDACILFIDNENVDYETVQTMFRNAEPGSADFIVLVIEDIGGSDLENRRQHVDSTLLNFLDGQEGMFTIPTLIVGTTNYLDSLQKSITSRPGRFDVVMEVDIPGFEESVQFTENFMKRPLLVEEKECIRGLELTPAYLRECVIRHKLDSIPFTEAVQAVVKQRRKSEKTGHRYESSDLGF